MNKYISFGVGVALLLLPVAASAQTVSSSNEAAIIASLQQLIQILTQELQQLLAAQGTTSATVSQPSATSSAATTSSNTASQTPLSPAGTIPTNAFQILVDVNYLGASDASQASLLAADGTWVTTFNSPSTINWPSVLQTLNAGSWTVSEDLASFTLGGLTSTEQDGFVSVAQEIGRLPDAVFLYNEGTAAAPPTQTALTDAQIASYASEVVPGFGPLGARLVVLNRTYQASSTYTASFQHALLNPDVSGGVFEVSPNFFAIPTLDFAAGCKYILSLGKKCYFLLPPGSNDGQEAPQNTTNYLGDVQQFINYLAQSGGLLTNPNLYIVLPVYNQPNPVHYISTSANDPESIESVVAWLKSYQTNMPAVTPLPPDEGRPPHGYLDSTSNGQIGGWAQDPDTPDWPIAVTYYIDGQAAGSSYADLYRSDLCSTLGSCDHAFSFSVPTSYCDGKTHTIAVYGIDSTIIGTNNMQLTQSPGTFECSSGGPVPPVQPTPLATSSPMSAPNPTATLTANGQNTLTIDPGVPITYQWSSTNGTSASAPITFTPSGGSANTTAQWTDINGAPLAANLSGTITDPVPMSAAGGTFVITYTVTGTNGQTVTAPLTLHINSTESDASRRQNLQTLQAAIEAYKAQTDSYPSSGSNWVCSNPNGCPLGVPNWTSTLSVLNVSLPINISTAQCQWDPNETQSYMYVSNGSWYKLIVCTQNPVASTDPDYDVTRSQNGTSLDYAVCGGTLPSGQSCGSVGLTGTNPYANLASVLTSVLSILAKLKGM